MSQVYFEQFPDQRTELNDLNAQADHGFIDRDAYINAVASVTGVSREDTTAAFTNEYVVNQPLIDFIRTELKPRYDIGLISNIGRDWIDDFFTDNQLRELFDVVVLSGEEGITKPDPRIFERAASRLGRRTSEIVFIDDIAENCKGAEVTGMKSIVFETNGQLMKQISQK